MAAQPYTVKVLLKHPHVVISEIHLAPGETTPRHSHAHDYVVHPKQDAKLVKTTYKAGAVINTETIEHKAGEPYYVAKSDDDTEFSLENIGSAAMMCEKTQLPPKP